MRPVLALAVLLAAGLTGCLPPAPDAAAQTIPAPAQPVAAAANALAVAAREEVQLATLGRVPDARPEPPTVADAEFVRCAVDLITRWEVGSQAAYTRKYQGVIWPGGQSGPTWGVGYDGGHQTRFTILRDWAEHDARSQLATSAGVIGQVARQRLPEWHGISTSFPFAAAVFIQVSLPQYTASTRRTFGPGFDSLSPGARCGLVSVVYNRGGLTTGPKRAEYRVIRDRCIPAERDREACVAGQVLAMQRLWPDVKGLRDRRADEARVIRGTIAPRTIVVPVKTFPQLYAPAPQPRRA